MMIATLLKTTLTASLFALAGWAHAGEMDGNWKTATDGTVNMYPGCGGYCGKVVGGAHDGKLILKMTGGNGSYSGTVVDPEDDKEYTGSATLQGGNKIKLKGCALKIFCKTQHWTKR